MTTSTYIVIILYSACTIVVCIILWFILSLLFRETAKRKAYKLLLRGAIQETLYEDFIYNTYKHYIIKNEIKILYIDFIESFILYARQYDNDGVLTKKIADITNPIIEKEKSQIPYSNIPEREKRLLLAIENFAINRENIALKNSLIELSEEIANNQKKIIIERKKNKWSIPTSIIGILLTIIMGFLGIIYSSLSDVDVEKISNHIYTSVTDSLKISNSDNIIINKNLDSCIYISNNR